jgi:RNA polymerase sigma-70 factor (ECF subfamily)
MAQNADLSPRARSAMTRRPWNRRTELRQVRTGFTWRSVPACRMLEGSPNTNGDVDLLRRIARGDTAALGSFYDLHAGSLFALACRILTDPKEAEDVLQEVFLQLWDKAASFDPALGRPLGWALTLTRNRAIDKLRALQRRRARLIENTDADQAQECPAASASPPETAGAHEQADLVRQALAQLPAEQRRAIELAFFEGLTQTEIATALDQPLGTVKARIRRGMLKLRSELEQQL